MKKITPKLPAIILIIGAAVRVIGTGAAALWYDESVILFRAFIPFMALFTNKTDQSGDLLLDLIERPLLAVSKSLWMLRLPSMVAGLVCLWLVWKLMQKLEFNPTQQILTASIVAVLPGLIWIAQDARSYSLVAVFGLAGLWFAITGGWLGLAACLGLMGYCHNTAVIYAASILAIYFIIHHNWKRALLAGCLCVLSWVPQLIHIVMSRVATGPLQPWAPVLTWGWTYRAITHAVWTHSSSSTLAVVGLLLVIPLMIRIDLDRSRSITLLSWVLPLTGLTVVSMAWNNILLYRTLMPFLFPFGLWLGYELGKAPAKIYAKVLRFYWLAILLVGLITWSPSARGAGLDQTAAEIRSDWRAGDVIVYGTMTVALPFDYYLADLPHDVLRIVRSWVLMEPGIVYPDAGDISSASRIWLIVPEDPCMTTDEIAQIDAAYPHGAPVMRLVYLQAAPINVYLIDR